MRRQLRRRRLHLTPVRALLLLIISLASGAAAAAPASEPAPSIVMVVFDEMPTVSLLGPDGSIDGELFPHFAQLAATSTWAPGASTVATRLLEVVPALLTGRMPGPTRQLSIRAEYPDNLFTWLAPTHDLFAIEPQSLLQPGPLDATAQAEWLTRARRDNNQAEYQYLVFSRFVHRIAARGLEQADERPRFDFIHAMLPYGPWRMTASGMEYFPTRMTGNFGSIWDEAPVHAEEGWRRHLAEARLADRLLGELMATLKQQGRFDDTLLVVTSNYGAGFWPGESRRVASKTTHPEDVLMVPLFVKSPGQKTGRVVEGVIQTVDVVPTIAQVLGMSPPWAMDGCSVLDAACARPAERKAMRLDGSPTAREFDVYPADLSTRRATLDRKHAIFPDVAFLEASWLVGRFESWRGSALDALPVATPTEPLGQWAVGRGQNDWKTPRGGPRVVARLSLTEAGASASGDSPLVAWALNGRVEALVPVAIDKQGGMSIQAMLPEVRVAPFDNTLEAFLVSGDGDSAKLLPLERSARVGPKRRPARKNKEPKAP